MISTTVEFEARMYLFDLSNCAQEYWFKADEGWDLCLATSAQKLELERKFHPTLSKNGLPEMLLQLHQLVKTKLHKANPHIEQSGHQEHMTTAPEFLIAFNRNRLR
ncbi:hypothetical protein [Desertivirga arenae]|uniref:hypothetical protein n=1 Tax=Desertivirga arenae TaxID=2810309 RepID=UPI001A97A2ED|nr:hypothetical protein [Pedobacter sp. SYSU D00823]